MIEREKYLKETKIKQANLSLVVEQRKQENRKKIDHANRELHQSKPNESKYTKKRSVSFDLSKNQIQVLPSMKAIKSTIKHMEEVNMLEHANFSTLSLTVKPSSIIPGSSCLPKSSALKPMNLIF
ncbi:hypothetical protein K502DRAFT_352785 [Neoconidiobolus thromboides FSU 785]|nr:hypothetical protein K502DRAFT_352785 [Neoconidiobolus thromboides FSU 785]